MTRPDVLAHRGYALRYPENSLPALEAAVLAGARHVEFDVQATADGVPVLLHDPDLERIGGDGRAIAALSLRQALRVPVGEADRLGPAFAAVRLCTLARAMAWLRRRPGVTAFCEIKSEAVTGQGLEPMMAAVLPLLRPLQARLVLISVVPGVVAAARDAGLASGWVIPGWTDANRTLAARLRPDWLLCNRRRLPPAPAPLWPGDWRWAVYEVRRAAEARQLARRGVGLVETMAVAELVAELAHGRS